MTLSERIAAPSPPLFKRVSRWGKILGIIGASAAAVGTFLAAPPVGLALGTYLVTGGTILGSIGGTAAAVAAATVDENPSPSNP